MSSPRLLVWNTLRDALAAPFSLRARSWIALSKPAIGIVITVMLPLLVSQIYRTGAGGWMWLVPFWATLTWFALEFQRQLLLGDRAAESTGGYWKRYGISLLAVGILAAFFAVFLGLLLYLVLPGVAFFVMAINSPQPWMALGTLLLWSLVPLVVAYPIMRMSLVFPGLAAGHSVSPPRIWRITRGRGLRLLLLLVVIPGLINSAILTIVPAEGAGIAQRVIAAILEIYLALVCLSLLAFAYRALSDQALPDTARTSGSGAAGRFASALKPLALILLLGVGIVAVWDSVYQVGPDELVFVSRFGKTERMESSPGLKAKVPFVEKTDTQPRQASFTTRGDGVFLTSDKKSLALGYEFRWRIVDAERFQRTIASQTRRADRMLEHAAENSLRNELIGLRGTDLDLLREAERLRFSVDEKTPLIAPLGAVIGDVNSRINEIGIAVNDWELSVATRER